MLEVQGVERQFAGRGGAPVTALTGIDLGIAEHEIVALIGASGCGKSTLLRILSGLDKPTGGAVSLDGRSITGPTPEIGMIFQDPRLMPWLTVRENIRVAVLDLDRTEQESRITQVLERVGLAHAGEVWPRELSGGMAQRVAIARALVRRPTILLMDEPFSALDAFTTASLQDHMLEIWEEERFTLVLVTHDLEEAVFLADRIVVMKPGPGRVTSEMQVDLPRPRDRNSEAVLEMKRQLAQRL
jgi:sulfonate transport system ATP-binding protein